MTQIVGRVRTIVGVSAQRVVADGSGLVVSVGFYVMVTAVVSSLWRAAASGHGGTVAGYGAAAVTWYIAASESATVALNIRMIEEIGDAIGGGAVLVELLRPASVLAVRAMTEVGRALPRLGVLIAAGAGLCLLVVGPPPSLLAALLALPSLVLAITCNLLAQHAFAAAAFWVRDARSTWFLYQKFVFILGGMLIPLEVLPHSLAAVARWLPFSAMAYAPARLMSGHVEPGLLLIQAGWAVALYAAAQVTFTAGERRLQAVGG
jgi:ABC-2 type transport system permease protein